MPIAIWMLRIAAGKTLLGLCLIAYPMWVTYERSNTPDSNLQLHVTSALDMVGAPTLTLAAVCGIGCLFWAYIQAKSWRGY